MDKLIFLGTGNAGAYHCEMTSLVLTNGQSHFICDGAGGSSVLLQLEKSGIPLSEVTDLFISHRHTDHLLGMIWLIRMIGHQFDRGQRTQTAHLYGHHEVLDIFRQVATLLMPSSVVNHFDKSICFHEVTDCEACAIGPWHITFFDTGAEKTTQFGWHTRLANQESLTFLGDEPLYESGKRYAYRCDHLIHEAFCLERDAEIYHPHRIHHSTVSDAAKNAQAMQVKHLILFHGEDKNLRQRKALYQAEARLHFSGKVSVPDDLDAIIFN